MTTDGIFGVYELSLLPQLRYTITTQQNQVFRTPSLAYKTARMVYDAECPAGILYFLNTEYIKYIEQVEMEFSGMNYAAGDQDAYKGHWISVSNLACSNRLHQGKLTGVTEN